MANYTEQQRRIARTLDLATQSVIEYSAPEVPPLGNLTPQGLLEEWGRLNEARKAIEKVEKIVQGRFLSQVGDAKELRGDNFNWEQGTSSRTALNQTSAKKRLQQLGELEEHLTTTEVTRNIVKRN